MAVKKIILIFLFSLFLFIPLTGEAFLEKKCSEDKDCPKGQICEKGVCVRPLEIEYPQIANLPVPKIVTIEIPQYVKYIFTLAVILVGLVIFGALIYSGVQYLTSAGSPARLSEAKAGILAGLLGGIILLSSYLIFQTINPRLTELKPPEAIGLYGSFHEGVYLCNYEYKGEFGDLGKILKDFILAGPIPEDKKTQKDQQKKQIEATQKLAQIIVNPKDRSKRCFRATSPATWKWGGIKKDDTMFIIPHIEIREETIKVGEEEKRIQKRVPIYRYGVILFEEERKWGGGCQYYPKEDKDGYLFTQKEEEHQIANFKPGDRLKFSAKSVWVFRKLPTEPKEDPGVSLYNCFAWGTTPGQCPEGVDHEKHDNIYGPGTHFRTRKDIRHLYPADLLNNPKYLTGKENKHYKNILSVGFFPKRSSFILFFDQDNDFKRQDELKGNCSVLWFSSPDIRYLPGLEKEGDCDWWDKIGNIFPWAEKGVCRPRIQSAIIIKGKLLGVKSYE